MRRPDGGAGARRRVTDMVTLDRAALVAAALILAASLLYEPGRMRPISFCAFRRATGVPCPFCGLTRSFCATGRGELGRAFRLHPAGPPLFLLTVAVFVVGVRDLFSRPSLLRRAAGARIFASLWTYLVAFAVLWIARLTAFMFFDSPA